MKIRRGIIIISCMVSALLFAGCGSITSSKDYVGVGGVSVPETNFSPEETVQVVFDSLKAAEVDRFNQYVCYPVERKGVVVSGYNIMFGNELDEEDRAFISNIFAGLTYEIETVGVDNDYATAKVLVSNKVFSDTSESEVVTKEIEILLIQTDGIWKMIIDDVFQDAASGGQIWSISNVAESILEDLF